MFRPRVIPALLIQDGKLVKGKGFRKHKYVGDPVNAIKIFNDKEVDEICFVDISARKRGQINYELIQEISSEAFMPFSYGGGIKSVEHAERLFRIGVEKVILNSELFYNPNLISKIAEKYGVQSTVASIDVKKDFFGRQYAYVANGTKNTKKSPVDYARNLEKLGVGEIILCSIDREGCRTGFDLVLLNSVAEAVTIPVVGQGGARSTNCLVNALVQTKISAVAAGDIFVHHGKHRAVLISYPSRDELKNYSSI